MGKRILAIDDESMILDAIKMILEDLGHVVHVTSDPLAGIETAVSGSYDLVITDVRMPVRNGAEVVESVLARKPGARILVITAYPDDPIALRALGAGAVGLLKKPFDITGIIDYLA